MENIYGCGVHELKLGGGKGGRGGICRDCLDTRWTGNPARYERSWPSQATQNCSAAPPRIELDLPPPWTSRSPAAWRCCPDTVSARPKEAKNRQKEKFAAKDMLRPGETTAVEVSAGPGLGLHVCLIASLICGPLRGARQPAKVLRSSSSRLCMRAASWALLSRLLRYTWA